MVILPRISIVIPSYNKEKYLGKTLKSIFSQKYPNLEVIVQDGGSTDGSVRIIKKYAKKYPSMKWVSKRDDGQLDAIRTGLNKVSGSVVNFINADDVLKKGALIEVGRMFNNNPGISWLVGRGDIIDDKGRVIDRWVTIYKNVLQNINNYKILLAVNYITQPSVFLSRKLYEKYGPFTGTKDYVMEYDLWLKIGRKEMPVLTNKYLSSFRLIHGTKSSTLFNSLLKMDNEIAEKYTNNQFLLMLHRIHNLGRVLLVKYL